MTEREELLIGKLESVANIMRGMHLDPRLAPDIKDALRLTYAAIDDFVDGFLDE